MPDFILWVEVPFGMRIIDHPDTVSSCAVDTDFVDPLSVIPQFDIATNSLGNQVLRGNAEHIQPSVAYFVVMNAQWAGRSLAVVNSIPNNGSFSSGKFDSESGLWSVEVADLAALEFIPIKHLTADDTTINASLIGESEVVDVNVTRLADVPTLTLVDQSGVQRLELDISSALTTALVDQDGSDFYR